MGRIALSCIKHRYACLIDQYCRIAVSDGLGAMVVDVDRTQQTSIPRDGRPRQGEAICVNYTTKD